MAAFQRFLIPPYLLRQLADASDIPERARILADHALQHFNHVAADHLAEIQRQGLIPPFLLKQLAESTQVSHVVRETAKRDLKTLLDLQAAKEKEKDPKKDKKNEDDSDGKKCDPDEENQDQDQEGDDQPKPKPKPDPEEDDSDKPEDKPGDKPEDKPQDTDDSKPKKDDKTDDGDSKPKDGDDNDNADEASSPVRREIYDMENSENEQGLPGTLIRSEDDEPVEDKAVNEVFHNIGLILNMFKDKFGWTGVDGNSKQDTAIVSTVHFGEEYENACKSYHAMSHLPVLTIIDFHFSTHSCY